MLLERPCLLLTLSERPLQSRFSPCRLPLCEESRRSWGDEERREGRAKEYRMFEVLPYILGTEGMTHDVMRAMERKQGLIFQPVLGSSRQL